MRFAATVTALVLLSVVSTPGAAQLRGFIGAATGVAVSTRDDLPGGGNGAGFSVGGQAGLWLSRVALGGEVAQYSTGSDRKIKSFGAFLRVPAMTPGPVRPYLVTGLGAYRYGSDEAGHRTAIGGSVGPGALFRLGGPLNLLMEARFHATFDRQPGLNTQQFFTIMAGGELRL